MSDYIIRVCLALCLAGMAHNALAQDEFSELNAAYQATPEETTHAGNWHGLLGGALIVLQQPVADSRTIVLPLVSLRYRDSFYWRFGQAGFNIWHSDDRRARLAVALKARRGYDPSDYPALAGMTQRKTSLEAGLSGNWLNHGTVFNYGIYGDIAGRSDGGSAQLSIAHPFRLAPRWFLTPAFGAEWLSDRVVDYYYGVTPAEATAGRPAYAGTATANLRVGLMLTHRLSREWSLFGGIGYTRLGTGISDSPIVIRDHIAALHMGAGWRF